MGQASSLHPHIHWPFTITLRRRVPGRALLPSLALIPSRTAAPRSASPGSRTLAGSRTSSRLLASVEAKHPLTSRLLSSEAFPRCPHEPWLSTRWCVRLENARTPAFGSQGRRLHFFFQASWRWTCRGREATGKPPSVEDKRKVGVFSYK